jgi:hypothetical protein
MKSKLILHGILLAVGLVVCLIYFSPVLSGLKLSQHDVQQAQAMQQEIKAHKEATGKSALWTNNLFSGMPAFMISVDYPSNFIIKVFGPYDHILPNPVNFAFLYFVGFYILLIVMGVNPYLAALGAIGFTLSSYNIVILEAGHTTKARSIALIAFIFSGLMLVFKGRYWLGAAIIAVFTCWQLRSNHMQITYYTFLMIGLYLIYKAVDSFMNKDFKNYGIATTITLLSFVIGVSPNISQLWVSQEYAKETIRGGSPLAKTTAEKTGLNKDYALNWSYGIAETWTLLIPNMVGGASGSPLGTASNTYEAMVNNNVPADNAEQYVKQMPTYWGPQPFTSGPVYLGAIFCFLFLLSFFILPNNLKWWALACFVFSIMLAWGKHFMPLSNAFLDYFPLYNKFRSVTMILVVASVVVPLMAILALQHVLENKVDLAIIKEKLKLTLYIVGGSLLFWAIAGAMLLTFKGNGDEQFKQQLMGNGEKFANDVINAIIKDRKNMLQMDAFRSLAFVLFIFGALWFFVTGKIKKNLTLVLISLAVVVDLWDVDKRFVNDDDFMEEDNFNSAYNNAAYDDQILQDKDLSYRVFNVAGGNPFNEAITSYHHKSIAGYHPAKLARYQDVIDSCLSKNNMAVINMLNTRYFVSNNKGQPVVQRNGGALGNAWSVDTIIPANGAVDEMKWLKQINPATTCVVDNEFNEYVKGKSFIKDSTFNIKLTKNELDYLTYQSQAKQAQLVVFSEIYYANKTGKGWQAYIDGKPVEHFRANYILRAMIVPAGNHQIEFKFEPIAYLLGEKYSLAGSFILLLLVAFAIFKSVQQYKNEILPIGNNQTNKTKK